MSSEKKRKEFWVEGRSEEKEYEDIRVWKAWSHELTDECDPIHVREILPDDLTPEQIISAVCEWLRSDKTIDQGFDFYSEDVADWIEKNKSRILGGG